MTHRPNDHTDETFRRPEGRRVDPLPPWVILFVFIPACLGVTGTVPPAVAKPLLALGFLGVFAWPIVAATWRTRNGGGQ